MDRGNQNDIDTQNDFRWLTSVAAVEHLQTATRLFEKNLNPLKTAKLLRKTITPQQAALIMEQAQLRIRGRRKFDQADSMFFTGKSLEQSTSSLLATYKARRFVDCWRVADLCCGIGGDLISLAQRKGPNAETVGVERDPVPAGFAAANLRAFKLQDARVANGSFEDFNLESFDAVHIDPDRRAKGRTTTGDFFEPSLSNIFDRVSLDRQLVAIKVAPATNVESLGFPVEREWIGSWRECKQQVLWAGPGIDSNMKVATVIAKDGARCHFKYSADATLPARAKMAESIGPYLYEPHASVLAARLGEALAHKYSLQYLSRGIAYMNSEKILSGVEPILKGYRVDDVLSVDLKQIHKKLKSMDAGQLVIKKRGVDQVIADKVSRLKLTGENKVTMILTRHDKSRRAILVTRMIS